MTCELCLLEKRTRWYFENNDFVIIECDTCNVPMCVWKHHGVKPKQEAIDEMQNKCREILGNGISFRMFMRKLPDHFHFHVKV